MIAIVGAGVAGPMLAHQLQKNDIECVVLEGDPSLSARHQGGMLNLNDGTGKPALQAAGLHDAVMEHVCVGADAMLIRDTMGAVLFEDPGDGLRPEIDRATLRRIIVEAVPPEIIRWNAKVRQVERNNDGFLISLADGTALHADAIVGADGAWSRVRPLLTRQKPVYTGITFIELRYLHASTNHRLAKQIVGNGLMFALAPGKGIIAHREPDDELCVYVALSVPDDPAPHEYTNEELVKYFRDWGADYQAMLARSDGPPVTRQLHALPTGDFWSHGHGVTLIGDAAHVMSPFAGEGVNLAMVDAVDLASAIIANPGDIDAAFASYERAMSERTIPFQAESAANLALAFADDAPAGFLSFFQNPDMTPNRPT